MDQARLDHCEVIFRNQPFTLELLDQGQGDPIAELPLQLLGRHADSAPFPKRLAM